MQPCQTPADDARPSDGGAVPPPPVALVTGAAVRLGRAIALGLFEAGYRVWIHHHRSAAAAAGLLATLREREGGERALAIVGADLGDAVARHELCDRVLDPIGPAGGRLDLFVASAASFERGAFLQRSDADLMRVLELNLVAPLSLARRFAAPLAEREGSIVNLVDLGAIDPWPEYLDHCVAKAALQMATRALAGELAPVRVNAIAPGPVLPPADMSEAERAALVERTPLRRLGEPKDIADTVVFLATARQITGQTVVVDGGLAGRRL